MEKTRAADVTEICCRLSEVIGRTRIASVADACDFVDDAAQQTMKRQEQHFKELRQQPDAEWLRAVAKLNRPQESLDQVLSETKSFLARAA